MKKEGNFVFAEVNGVGFMKLFLGDGHDERKQQNSTLMQTLSKVFCESFQCISSWEWLRVCGGKMGETN